MGIAKSALWFDFAHHEGSTFIPSRVEGRSPRGFITSLAMRTPV